MGFIFIHGVNKGNNKTENFLLILTCGGSGLGWGWEQEGGRATQHTRVEDVGVIFVQ